MCQRSIPTRARGLDIDDEVGFSVSGIIVSRTLSLILSRLLASLDFGNYQSLNTGH